MTEEEARAKWCPFTRAMVKLTKHGQTVDFVTANRLDEDDAPANSRCFASDCMAWRWTSNFKQFERDGFCGLVGPASGKMR